MRSIGTESAAANAARMGSHHAAAGALAFALVLAVGPAASAATEGTPVVAPVRPSVETASIATPVPPAAEATPVAGRSRPRIGLVLGGGGAKGAAHVGVLRVLDEMRIPIDCVAGTSMGALVGGAYSAGTSAVDLEQAVRAISWKNAIAFEGHRVTEPMHRKLSGVTYSNDLQFGLRDRRVTAPTSLIGSQNIDRTIESLIVRSQDVTDFDRLPIQFRAVATDMIKGEMAVLDQGSLARAMRASMSVPGLLAPVMIDGRLLGDGGLTRNLPVDVVRDACADVVIAVIVPAPAPTLKQLRSPLAMAGRTLDIMIGANERQQIDSLRPGDVMITVPVGDIGQASFDKVAEAIPLGRVAALEHRDELARYSLPQDEYDAWRASVTRADPAPVKLAGVRIEGAVRVNPDYVREALRLEAGDVVTTKTIADHIDDVYALGDFDTVRYVLSGPADAPTLDVLLAESATGPNSLHFDVGLYLGTDTSTAFTLVGDFRRTWINPLGGELHGAASVGHTSGVSLSVYQPLDVAHRWFVEPGLIAQRAVEGIYSNGNEVADYAFNSAWGYLDAGRVIGTNTELRAGVRAGGQSVKRDIALPTLDEIDWEGYGGTSLRYTYDDRDRDILPRSGLLARVAYFQSENWLGAAADYQRLEGMFAYALPVGSNVAYLRAAGGSSLGSTLPAYDQFQLGGPISFPGFAIGELRGNGFWTTSATYLQRVAEISELFGQALYVGATLTAGAMDDQLDFPDAGIVYSGALLFGGRTPLGPLTMTLAGTSEGEWQLMFDLGRPILEHTIMDPLR